MVVVHPCLCRKVPSSQSLFTSEVGNDATEKRGRTSVAWILHERMLKEKEVVEAINNDKRGGRRLARVFIASSGKM